MPALMANVWSNQPQAPVHDFTSALYLGMHHPSRALRHWEHFSTGRPAALETPPRGASATQWLAALQGCERATLAPSTLHLFWDVFGLLARQKIAIYLDAGVYPIARWGVERALAHHVPVQYFPHHDPDALPGLLKRYERHRPIIVADGFCPGCGRTAPLEAYVQLVDAFEGQLILDDTQALGILGQKVASFEPYGQGGGGTLPWKGLKSQRVLAISSLAKGFGVPVAVLAGSHEHVLSFEDESETRMHCSPPSNATIRALEHAREVNRTDGAALRKCLARLVSSFRFRLEAIGLSTIGGLFPIQTLIGDQLPDPVELHRRLLKRNVRAVLHGESRRQRAALSFIITTDHRPPDLDYAAEVLQHEIRRMVPLHLSRRQRCSNRLSQRVSPSPTIPCSMRSTGNRLS